MDVSQAAGKGKTGLSKEKSFASRGWKRILKIWKREGDEDGLLFKDLLYAVGLTAAAAFVFYRSWYGMVAGVLLIPLLLKSRQKERKKQREEELMTQFRSAMQVTAGALLAGYSLEGAWVETERELRKLYGGQAVLSREFSYMNHKIRMNEPMEELFLDFAYGSGCEDICNFAEIFKYAKRNGGNMAEIIHKTLRRMRAKAEIMEDIRTAVTAKKLEQKMLMLLMPGVLLFVTISSPEYVQTLYHTLTGALVMTLCLAAYLFAAWWSAKIMDIQV